MTDNKKTIIESSLRSLLGKPTKTPADLEQIKRNISKKAKISCLQNVELLKAYHKLVDRKSIKESKTLENLLKKRPIRSLSGVAVVTVLTKPYPCPGKCIYCPQEKNFPKSYLSGEPAAQRAKNLNFNPYLQIKKRLESLKVQGHPIDKIELIILGGSFNYYPKKYQEWFVKKCFQACNGIKNNTKQNLKDAQKENERTKCRIVGMTIETRPDLINKKEVLWLRNLGVTKVEMGVQSTDEKILKKNKRNHSIKKIKEATKLLKDAGLKITYHLMINLPESTQKKDFLSFKKAFSDPDFRPDWLKIYPCVVCRGSKLYTIWKKGNYTPYTEKELIKILIKIKSQILPYWTRVGRLFRDIPSPKIEAGCRTSNLREFIQKEMKEKGLVCKCIRCREVKDNYDIEEKIFLFRENYEASKGKEIFLSFENKKRTKLFAFLRLRIPSIKNHFIPALQNSAIIRELHTYGKSLQIKKTGSSPQHKGFGKKLMVEAEKIAKKEFKINKIAVISGIGVREYYKKIGYSLEDEYMTKVI